jgi:hypothetical protein
MEKKNEMKRRTPALKRVNPLKAGQRQSMYEVIFVTYKIADKSVCTLILRAQKVSDI